MDELRFKYTEADYLQACKLHLNSGRRWMLRWAIVLVAFVLAVLLLLMGRPVWLAVAIFAVPVAIAFWSDNVLLPLIVKKRMRELKPLQEEIVLRVQDDRIEVESSAGGGTHKWFLRVIDSPEMLLCMVNQVSFVMVPRRVCADDAQYARIKAVGESLTGN